MAGRLLQVLEGLLERSERIRELRHCLVRPDVRSLCAAQVETGAAVAGTLPAQRTPGRRIAEQVAVGIPNADRHGACLDVESCTLPDSSLSFANAAQPRRGQLRLPPFV